jgi:hypothetical protein
VIEARLVNDGRRCHSADWDRGRLSFSAWIRPTARGVRGSRYRRPYAVPERLDLLRGPSSGTIHLPSHLDWSGNAVYDLDAPGRVVDLYRAVLIEAATPQDLYAYLDEKVLGRRWALLWLPAQLRRAWEQRFPVLAEISRIPLCQYQHDVCVHRQGWRIVLHPDGTTSAYGPRGQILHSNSPPTTRAG